MRRRELALSVPRTSYIALLRAVIPKLKTDWVRVADITQFVLVTEPPKPSPSTTPHILTSYFPHSAFPQTLSLEVQTQMNSVPHASLPGLRGHAMMRKGSSQHHVKDARAVNGYLPIERFPRNFRNGV